MHTPVGNIMRYSAIWPKEKSTEYQLISVLCGVLPNPLVIRVGFIHGGNAVLTVNVLECERETRLTHLSRIYFNVLHQSAKTDSAKLQNFPGTAKLSEDKISTNFGIQ